MKKPTGQGGPGRGQGRPPGTRNKKGHNAGRPVSTAKLSAGQKVGVYTTYDSGDPSYSMWVVAEIHRDSIEFRDELNKKNGCDYYKLRGKLA